MTSAVRTPWAGVNAIGIEIDDHFGAVDNPSLTYDAKSGLDRLMCDLVYVLADTSRLVLMGYDVPPLYESGVRYKWQQQDPHGRTATDTLDAFWQEPTVTMLLGGGDCKSLCGWRLGELWIAGVDAWPIIEHQVSTEGQHRYHVLIGYRDAQGRRGREDPSERLGMSDANRPAPGVIAMERQQASRAVMGGQEGHVMVPTISGVPTNLIKMHRRPGRAA